MAQHIENYWYIGKDGKPITAKELEDQRDMLRAALDRLVKTLWVDGPNGRDIVNMDAYHAAKEALK